MQSNIKMADIYSVFFAITLLVQGCVTTGSPESGATDTVQDAPLIERVLADLAANDRAIENFRASGKFMLKSPELQDVQVLRQSSIRFRRPADLHVVGRKYSKAVFKLTCSGEGFLIEIPTESQYFYSDGGARFSSVSRSVSPRDIANEMFFSEVWSELNPNAVVLSDLTEDGSAATLNVYESRRRSELRRTVRVVGPPWRVVENTRYDGGDQPVAITALSGHREREGAWYATAYETQFPGENAFMQFEASTFEINAEMTPGDFDLDQQLADVKQKGYQPLERSGH